VQSRGGSLKGASVATELVRVPLPTQPGKQNAEEIGCCSIWGVRSCALESIGYNTKTVVVVKASKTPTSRARRYNFKECAPFLLTVEAPKITPVGHGSIGIGHRQGWLSGTYEVGVSLKKGRSRLRMRTLEVTARIRGNSGPAPSKKRDLERSQVLSADHRRGNSWTGGWRG